MNKKNPTNPGVYSAFNIEWLLWNDDWQLGKNRYPSIREARADFEAAVDMMIKKEIRAAKGVRISVTHLRYVLCTFVLDKGFSSPPPITVQG